MLKKIIRILLGFSLLFAYSCTGEANIQENTHFNLKQSAQEKKILLGTAVEPGLLNNAQYRQTVIDNFNAISPENVMKMGSLHPQRENYNFGRADKLAEFAAENDMALRGHTLVWHSQAPDWVNNGDWTRDELIEVLKDHIYTVAGHFKGQIYAWDVVNEAFDGGNYRKTIWYNVIGPEYIEMAFKWAHEADPQALLYYNDYSMEGINIKSDKVYNEVKKLLENGVPIHGIGLQTHLTLDTSYDFESMYQNVKRFNDLGLKVDITEADIKIKSPASEKDLEKQAIWYGKLMELLLSTGKNDTFIIWGVDENHSWIPGFAKGYDDALVFDREYQAKEAVAALASAIDNSPQELPYKEWKPLQANGRYQSAPFVAHQITEKTPSIDGIMDDKEWENAVVYPFIFNQLNPKDLRLDNSSIEGDWRVLFKGNKLYGAVTRKDDITVNNHPTMHENDGVEVFVEIDGNFTQLRTLVGQDWENDQLSGKAQWNEEGTLLEFMLEIPDQNPTGLRIGWNIALSDNDLGPDATRSSQAYPINGNNLSWQGIDLAELQLEGITPRPAEEPRMILPFQCPSAQNAPEIDGIISQDEWSEATIYPMGFNQLSTEDQRAADSTDLQGYWSVMHIGNRLYGRVHRRDDITSINNASSWENDNVEIFIKNGDDFVQLRSLIGEDWEPGSYEGNQEAKWNQDGTVLEFSVDIPGTLSEKSIIGWNIGLSDNDGDSIRERQIYPLTGYNESYQAKDLGELLIY